MAWFKLFGKQGGGLSVDISRWRTGFNGSPSREWGLSTKFRQELWGLQIPDA